jgi:hypothetical protein
MIHSKPFSSLLIGLLSFGISTGAALAQAPAPVTIGVTSPAVLFSPGTWSGDSGRSGTSFRQTWLPGAWVKFYWITSNPAPTADLEITYGNSSNSFSYFIDGNFVDDQHAAKSGAVSITGLKGSGRHELDVYMKTNDDAARWIEQSSWKVSGLVVDSGATEIPAPKLRPWVLEIGDSITEGVLADNGQGSSIADYSFLTGQALNQIGYDYAVSACGWSGWLNPGDAGQDVPPYYKIANGIYDDKDSRWNKIDSTTSLLDKDGKISAYGETGTPPAMITINYATNEELHLSNYTDLPASIEGGLSALRKAAPDAWIVVYVPFNLYSPTIYPRGVQVINILKTSVDQYKLAHPRDKRTVLVDYGPEFSQTVVTAGGGDIHPNLKGHELIAAHTTATVVEILSNHSH